MIFEEALKEELSSIDGISNKVFPLNATEGVKPPFVIYVSNEGIPDKSLDGYLSTKEVDCEINIVHNTYSDMKFLTKQVLAKISSFQGRIIGDNGPFIQNITYEKPVELYENEIFAYRSVTDIKIRF